MLITPGDLYTVLNPRGFILYSSNFCRSRRNSANGIISAVGIAMLEPGDTMLCTSVEVNHACIHVSDNMFMTLLTKFGLVIMHVDTNIMSLSEQLEAREMRLVQRGINSTGAKF
jgi:hypothetical protein